MESSNLTLKWSRDVTLVIRLSKLLGWRKGDPQSMTSLWLGKDDQIWVTMWHPPWISSKQCYKMSVPRLRVPWTFSCWAPNPNVVSLLQATRLSNHLCYMNFIGRNHAHVSFTMWLVHCNSHLKTMQTNQTSCKMSKSIQQLQTKSTCWR